MKRKTTPSRKKLKVNERVVSDLVSRTRLSYQMGYQYGDKRKLYEALGYPNEVDLTFDYFYRKYKRQGIANAIINRPSNAMWRGDIIITEPGENGSDSVFNKAWSDLNNRLKVKSRLNKADKLCEIGRFSIIVFGFDDVKVKADYKKPVLGKPKLLYITQFAENAVTITEYDNNPRSARYGAPEAYTIKAASVEKSGELTSAGFHDIVIHHSRVLHITSNNLTNDYIGESKLHPIINRIVDLEKILGGDAEMFWRGARPGYTATARPDYELGQPEREDLFEQLDGYEHDLRRFLAVKGVDIEALESQIEDPLNHIDAQLQEISCQTGIPKRILIGSERGELASSQDTDQWLTLIQNRRQDFGEPIILRPFIDRLILYGVLPKVKEYNIQWEDLFSPSDLEKAKVGKERAEALKTYADSPYAAEAVPLPQALKLLLGLTDSQIKEVLDSVDSLKAEDRIVEEEEREEEEREGPDNEEQME